MLALIAITVQLKGLLSILQYFFWLWQLTVFFFNNADITSGDWWYILDVLHVLVILLLNPSIEWKLTYSTRTILPNQQGCSTLEVTSSASRNRWSIAIRDKASSYRLISILQDTPGFQMLEFIIVEICYDGRLSLSFGKNFILILVFFSLPKEGIGSWSSFVQRRIRIESLKGHW